ncbi:hypothetical protein LGQ02_04925 [Bacillus shivajii]|uniref:hypothetical protein n=1 Tax=Bacillus shivajii TaxID=1983719 RepID=UPI001CFA464E|nr:hypothetical protein [Bacillus shivajii]UCZ54126.1 hypothetical protein LGQ02_04925 [Bacillus shivajii]
MQTLIFISFLLIFFAIWLSPFFKKYRQGKLRTSTINTTLLVILFTNIVFLIVIDLFTASPDSWSGNGNPAILFVLPFILLFSVFCYMLSTEWYRRSTLSLRIVLIITLPTMILASIFHTIHITSLLDALGGTPTVADSKIYRFGWFNQYTNTLFFNIYTYIFTIAFTIMITTVTKTKFKPRLC